jgi:hypothetical protein
MISVHVQGGLGNQLFQLFAGASLALDTNRNLCMYFDDHKRKSLNGIFYIVPQQPSVRFQEHKETREFEFSPLPQRGNIRLHGYFQNVQYFQKRFSEIVDVLKIKHDVSYTLPGTVIHVRRTDYTTLKHFYVQLDDSYYLPSIHDLPKPFTIVTDDAQDAYVQNLASRLDATVRSTNTVDDFWFISAHDNIVCANSSFSVMAALFARKRNRDVRLKLPETFLCNGCAIKI